MTRRTSALAVLAVVCLGIASRAAPLLWSPLPATLDGFDYARLAGETIAAGGVPFAGIAADELIFTLNLSIASLLTGVEPLFLAQGYMAAIGGAVPVIGVLLVSTLARKRTNGRWLRTVALLAGVALVLDGILLRRTGVPDEEAMGLLLVPLLALGIDRLLRTHGTRWALVSIPMLSIFPLLHNFSSFHAVLTITAVVALHARRSVSTLAIGGLIGAGFWAYFFGYYALAERLPLEITYSGLIRGHLGLLSAWVILMIGAVLWIMSTSRRRQRLLYTVPLALWFAVLVANAVRPVFPGTISTQTSILLFASGFTVIVALGVIGFPGTLRTDSGRLVLALVAGPATVVFYTLTASLTPGFWDAVLRAQTFAHVGAVVFACGGVLFVYETNPKLAKALALALLLGMTLTMPLGYMNLDTGTYPSTTFESEHQAVLFFNQYATVSGTTADTLTRIDRLYYPTPPQLIEGPARAWLTSGRAPTCPVLLQESWGTTGAHLYPLPPGTIEDLDAWTASHDKVYAAGGYDPVSLQLPAGAATVGCSG